MTGVRFFDSLRYGAKLFASVMAVVLLGGAAIAGGTALALPEQVPAVTGPAGTARLAGGALLAALGTAVVVIGLLGAVHKLIADSVSAGQAVADATSDERASAPVPGEERAGEVPATDADPVEGSRTAGASERPDEPVPDEEPFEDWVQKTPKGTEDARQEPADEEVAVEDQQRSANEPSRGSENRREPSPGEIAFGIEEGPGGGEDTAETTVGQDHEDGPPVDGSGGTTTPEGASSGGDPLAESTDEE